jgi:hypothetical protein
LAARLARKRSRLIAIGWRNGALAANSACKIAQPCPVHLPTIPRPVVEKVSFDDLVSSHLHDQGHCQPKCLRCSEVYDQLEFGGLKDRQVSGLGAFQNFTDIHAGLTVHSQPAANALVQPGNSTAEVTVRNLLKDLALKSDADYFHSPQLL